ncbi:putative nuclease HARBI1 [Merluccius polli]|uniref:Nuclease HARBI1 n=1 Tax=Merluccius polli TaxID=89951 RepID=A0AA47N4I2_MERPO|nr:putative nuclease HARBI1 [Merluccius polli]
MMVQEPGWEFGRDTGVSTPTLAMSATGSLVTTGSQDLGFNVSSEKRCSRQDRVPISVPGHWGSYIGQRDEHPLLALQHLYIFIRFPLDNQQLHRIKANFMACRYAGVVGAVDGTHIQIIAPSKDEDVFVNRKNVHSINTQIVFDATFNILDVAKWPAGVYP